MGPDPKEEGWSSEELIVLAGADLPYETSFYPDWWIVQVSEPISLPVYVYRNPGALTERMRLIGTGQRAFPGKKGERRIILRNTGLVSAKLQVIASVGYPPTQLVDPVTVASPLTAEIQAQTKYEIYPTPGLNLSFIHPHTGRDVIVGANHQRVGGALDNDITSITVAGVMATLLGKAHQNGTTSGGATGWWIARNIAEGNVQIAIVNVGYGGDHFYSQAFSYLPGIRTGNITVQGSLLANPPAIVVIGQELGSVVLCCAGSYSAGGGVLSEQSGAPAFDPIHILGGYVGMWKREGIGSQTFDLLLTVAGTTTIAALEILPIG